MLIVADFASDVWYTHAYEATVIGKYIYFRNDGRTVQLYQNGTLMEFVDAYKSGAIDDKVLDEISEVMKFDRFAYPGEISSDIPETTVSKNSTPDSPSESKINSKTATADSPDSVRANNSNGAIATGDNSISFLVPTAFLGIAALALIHLKKKEM